MEVFSNDGARRRFKVSDSHVEEIENGRSEKVAGEDNAGHEGGKQDLKLESTTPEQLEKERKQQAQREEVKRRQNAPLATGRGETGQTLLGLGGQEEEDLFNRTGESGETTPAVDVKALGAKAAKASMSLGALAGMGDAQLRGFRGKLAKAGRTDKVQAIDDLLAYRKYAKDLPPNEGGKFSGNAEFNSKTGELCGDRLHVGPATPVQKARF